MCAISGMISQKEIDLQKLALQFMDIIGHRGPDESGMFLDKDICLTHNRLSIIDLVHGKQPIDSHDKRFVIVHNGEIYNFKELKEELLKKGIGFFTDTDTEVIVERYAEKGSDCLKDFNGDFAFAIWDRKTQTLFAARDRMGIKPFYYYIGEEGFFFSSGLRPLLRLPFLKKEIDYTALSEYFQHLYISAPRTIIKDIKKLEPGNYLIYSKKTGRLVIEKYWDLKEYMKQTGKDYIEDEEICMDKLRGLLQEAVKMRLVSDVELGVFLSGGVDSSIIAFLASRAFNGRLKTFSIGFEGMGYYDETRYAKEVAELLDTEHHTLYVKPQIESDLVDIVKHFEEPFGDSSAVPTYYLCRQTKKSVKVALSGSGGDDLFAGYRRYLISNGLFKTLEYVSRPMRTFINSALERLPSTRTSKLGEKVLLAKRFLNITGLSDFEKHLSIITFFDFEKRKKLFANAEANKQVQHEEFWGMAEGYVNNALYFDMMTYLAGDLLPKEDLMGMAFGLENRVPFLDHRVVELSFRIPAELKVKKHTTKYILRRAFEGLLPRHILYRGKHGFALPISEWIREDLYSFVSEILLSGKTDRREILDIDYIAELLRTHRENKEDLGQHIWSILIFELWCREFLD